MSQSSATFLNDLIDAITELLLPMLEPFGPSEPLNLLESCPKLGRELAGTYGDLKRICTLGVTNDAVIPALSASLEWMKAVGGQNLPTNFEEMELDCECKRIRRTVKC